MPLEDIVLEPEQEELLAVLVEAARNVPHDKRQTFMALCGDDQLQIFHPGLAGRARRVQPSDINALRSAELVAFSGDTFIVTPRGLSYYEELNRRSGQPLERVEATVIRYIDDDHFQQAYPAAYQKWAQAERMLWASDTKGQLTAIGHYCREALFEFATALVERYQPPALDAKKAETVNRLRAVLGLREPHLGETEGAFLRALVAYWGTVSDLAQRQEHGAQKEGRPLVWEDARRVVFQTAMVMLEVDASLSRDR